MRRILKVNYFNLNCNTFTDNIASIIKSFHYLKQQILCYESVS